MGLDDRTDRGAVIGAIDDGKDVGFGTLEAVIISRIVAWGSKNSSSCWASVASGKLSIVAIECRSADDTMPA